MPARAPRRLALAAAAAFSLSVDSPAPAAAAQDGGTIRAQGVIVPPSMAKRGSVTPEPAAPLSVLASPDVLAALGDFRPDIGAWAEYSVTEQGHQTSRFLVSVLPPPMPDGRYWLEIDTVDASTLAAAIRMLTKGNPSNVAGLERALIQVPGQALFEVPLSALPQAVRKETLGTASGAKITSSKKVSLKVKAGTFQTERIHIVKGKETFTVWRSSEVPLFGMVRAEGGGKITELFATGRTGAHTLISEPITDENIPSRREDDAPEQPQGNGSDNKK